MLIWTPGHACHMGVRSQPFNVSFSFLLPLFTGFAAIQYTVGFAGNYADFIHTSTQFSNARHKFNNLSQSPTASYSVTAQNFYI